MFTMVMASVMSVTAADSKTKEPTIAESSKPVTGSDGQQHGFIIREGADEFKNETTGQPSEVKSAVLEFNKGAITAEKMVGENTEVGKKVKEKTALTEVFDLHKVGNPTKNAAGKYEVVLVVPGLTNEYKDIIVVHYSHTGNAWEVIEVAESNVDYTKKEIKAEFTDFSPVAIFATKTAAGTGTEPSPLGVGTSSTWMLWAAAALVVVGAGVVVSQKKSR